jgi:predicted nucleic acid-binding protein
MKHTSQRVAVSNTGPLISALQSDCMHIIFQFYDQIHIPVDEIIEYEKHGAGQEISKLLETGFLVTYQDFTQEEADAAKAIAAEIAGHRTTRDKNPLHHLPESYAIVLMQRSGPGAIELLIDELAARDVARLRKVPIIGFPGILIRACRQRIIEPEEVLSALEECRRQGTHYSPRLINEIYNNLKRP